MTTAENIGSPKTIIDKQQKILPYMCPAKKKIPVLFVQKFYSKKSPFF